MLGAVRESAPVEPEHGQRPEQTVRAALHPVLDPLARGRRRRGQGAHRVRRDVRRERPCEVGEAERDRGGDPSRGRLCDEPLPVDCLALRTNERDRVRDPADGLDGRPARAVDEHVQQLVGGTEGAGCEAVRAELHGGLPEAVVGRAGRTPGASASAGRSAGPRRPPARLRGGRPGAPPRDPGASGSRARGERRQGPHGVVLADEQVEVGHGAHAVVVVGDVEQGAALAKTPSVSIPSAASTATIVASSCRRSRFCDQVLR